MNIKNNKNMTALLNAALLNTEPEDGNFGFLEIISFDTVDL